MVSTTDTPTKATQRGSRSNGNVALDDKVEQAQRGEHDRRDDHNRRDDSAERRDQGDTSQRSGHDRSDDGQNNNRDVSDNRKRGADRNSNHSDHERGSGGDRDSRDADQKQGIVTNRDSKRSDAADVFAPVLGAWKQVFASWVQLANSLGQAQQQAVGQMLAGVGTRAEAITDGADRGRERALTSARTSSAPDGQTERNQR